MPKLREDGFSKTLIPKDHMFSGPIVALKTTGDGSCLYSSLSLLLKCPLTFCQSCKQTGLGPVCEPGVSGRGMLRYRDKVELMG